MILAGLLAGCALPAASMSGDVEGLHSFAMEARGHSVVGLAAVSVGDEPWRLDALLPTGTTLFSVTVGDEVDVQAPDPELVPFLSRIPFRRDLAALYRYRCELPRCRAGAWRWTRLGPEAWRIRGPGGVAELRRRGAVWELQDRRRGYTLRVVAP